MDIKKKVLSTGIRVGTQVKTKFMKPFITKASPEGLYMLDLDITLKKIKNSSIVLEQKTSLFVQEDSMQILQLRNFAKC
jgi:ribosomal protein S2